MYHAPHYQHRIDQGLSVSVRPPSRACHPEVLRQVDLGLAHILHHHHICGFPRPMSSLHTAFRVVEQKCQSTVHRAVCYHKNFPGSRQCVNSSQFHDQLMDSHKCRLCNHNGSPLRTVAHFGFAESTSHPTG